MACAEPRTLTSTALKLGLAAWACGCALGSAAADGDSGLGRLHAFKDWVVGCDNTLHCEAQGYPPGGDDAPDAGPAALLVRRASGPGRAPSLHLAFGSFERESFVPGPDDPVTLHAGPLRLALAPPPGRDAERELPAGQVAPLLAWALRGDRIRLTSGTREWSVSLAGAAAALLKMDELQGRVGTPGALARPGNRPESTVPAPAVPRVQAARLPPTTPADRALEPRLRAALKRSDDDCPDFDPAQALDAPVRLTPSTLLVSQACYRGAYQTGSRLLLIDDKPPHRTRPVVLPMPGADGDGGDSLVIEQVATDGGTLRIHESAKGRGIGDCWAVRAWTWTGSGFALLSASESPCKAFEAGGLPVTLWRTQGR